MALKVECNEYVIMLLEITASKAGIVLTIFLCAISISFFSMLILIPVV